jgi:dihydrofolate synthase/folylpolyglutamate synthase
MNYAEALAALDARTNYERTGRLVAPTRERIEALVDLLDHPERNYPVIHVTGTNGKTTTARAATETLRAAGLRVATYTSPHVSDVRERFAYDGAPISEDDFVEAWSELAPYLDLFDSKGMVASWFEAATALAFVYFADKAVDAAVIEVGMGGTWDATNVVDAQVAVITPVGLDHPELGATAAEAAREKSGIIKRNTITICAVQEPDVAGIIKARCDDVGAQLRLEGDAFAIERSALAVGGQVLRVRLGDRHYDDVFLPMFGAHFARDATMGVAAARALLGEQALDDAVVVEGFHNTTVPGRMEIAGRSPLVVLDGAHNPAGAEALAAAMRQAFTWERLIVVAAVMRDKDVRGVLAPLAAIASELIVTQSSSPRATPAAELGALARTLGIEARIEQNVADAIHAAIGAARTTDAVLVSGSLYTVGDARRILVRERRHPEEIP